MADDWQYATASDLDQPLAERLRRFPREDDLLIFTLRLAAAALMRAWLASYHRLRITGREHLPASGSFVLVANHASHLDAPCLLAALPWRQLHRAFPAAAADYFFVSLPRLLVAAIVVNALPFSRQVGQRGSLALCRGLLGNPGNVLLLFPEGTRTRDGALGEFKPGVGALLAGTPIPAIPCHLEGAFAAWPKGRWLPRPRRLHLRLGPPRAYPAIASDHAGFVHIAHDLRAAVQALAPPGQ